MGITRRINSYQPPLQSSGYEQRFVPVKMNWLVKTNDYCL